MTASHVLKKVEVYHRKNDITACGIIFVKVKKRDDLIRYLRNKNIDVSSWYPSLHYINNNNQKRVYYKLELNGKILEKINTY